MPLKDIPNEISSEEEQRVTRNVVHVLEGLDANIAIACLIKVMESLIVGVALSKGQAVKYSARISKHLKKQFNKHGDEEFGYLYSTEDNSPILHDKSKGPLKH